MMDDNYRLLFLFEILLSGGIVSAPREAKRFGVSPRTVERDLQIINEFLAEKEDRTIYLHYNRSTRDWRLRGENIGLSNGEILAICKILIESRAFKKEEIYPIVKKLILRFVPDSEYRKVLALIDNEMYHYQEPHHGPKYFDLIWDIGNAVYEQTRIEVMYKRLSGPGLVIRILEPMGILFSNSYFYMIANIWWLDEKNSFPKQQFLAVYRLDRIQSYKILKEKFYVSYSERFEEGKYRKRIHFKTGGELRQVKFWYCGISMEEIQTLFPTAEVIKEMKEKKLIRAEAYGDEAVAWLQSQEDVIEIVDNKVIDQLPIL